MSISKPFNEKLFTPEQEEAFEKIVNLSAIYALTNIGGQSNSKEDFSEKLYTEFKKELIKGLL